MKIITSFIFGILLTLGFTYTYHLTLQKKYDLVVEKLLTAEQKQILPFLKKNSVVLQVQVTAYDAWSYDSINTTKWNKPDGKTSLNRKAVVGRTIAVDPYVIPLETNIFIPNFGWRVAEDVGALIKGNKIDLLMPSQKQAKKFGKKVMFILWNHD